MSPDEEEEEEVEMVNAMEKRTGLNLKTHRLEFDLEFDL